MGNELTPGSTIDEFTLGDLVHRGPMGSIFRVTKSGIAQPLLMKVPHVGPGNRSESLVAFQTEAMIGPTLAGPHVPRFVAVGDVVRTPYLVIEWIEGQRVEDMLAPGALPPAEVARVGAAIADALHALHQQEVIHLDLKPENVILRENGEAVLIDFGLAHHARLPDLLAEEIRFRAGSEPYVSPEQLLGTRDDRRSDLFALGVILYELATGKLPFGEPDTDVRNRLWLEPAPPSSVAPDLPPWMQEVILRCLEPRAERRYQSAAHVAFDLRNPEQVVLTARAKKAVRSGLVHHLDRFLGARREYGARLHSPAPLLNRTPIVLAAIDTDNIDDERHPAIRFALAQMLAQSTESRLLCLTVIPPQATPLEHLVRLRNWSDPLRLPALRISLHVIESSAPADVILEIARHNNVDLVVVGAPAPGGRAWPQSVASSVTARATCSVHVVRVAKSQRGREPRENLVR